MARMVSDPGQPGDQFGDSRQGPQIGAESARPRAIPQRSLHPGQLRGVQSRLPTRAARAFEPRPSLGLPRVEPEVGTDPGDPQRLRHRHLRFATREQPRGVQPTRLHRGQIPCGRGHASTRDRTRKIR